MDVDDLPSWAGRGAMQLSGWAKEPHAVVDVHEALLGEVRSNFQVILSGCPEEQHAVMDVHESPVGRGAKQLSGYTTSYHY